MSLHLQPARVDTGSSEEECELVFADGRLVAVLVRLSDDHEDEAGLWFLKVGFGRVDQPDPPTFADLDAALVWIARQLSLAS